MRYGTIDRPHTGVTVPLSSLRSERGCGVGEFADLGALADWCAEAGLDLIQILPVQDSGGDPSPYGAMSAFALHPLYVRLDDVDGAEPFLEEIAAARERLNALDRLDYAAVQDFKLDLLRRIFQRHDPAVLRAELDDWMGRTARWLKPYCAFRWLKEEHGGRAWWDWDRLVDPTVEAIERLWEEEPDGLLFWAWVQAELERQFLRAIERLERRGIRLKGDVPILLNEDSADVWLERQWFRNDRRAGAPPDFYSKEGQNWGFPLYRWDRMTADGYGWWKRRLRRADRFFHALRIDHVLGFFRIWSIPADAKTGMLGQFDPALPLSREIVRACGFDDAQIDAFLRPGGDGEEASERTIFEIEDEGERERRLEHLYDRILLIADGDEGDVDHLRPLWLFHESAQFQALSEEQREALWRLSAADAEAQEIYWEQIGRQRLGMMEEATELLICGEDLGTVPDCVAPVLKDLNILALRVDRWMRRFDVEGAPWIDPSEYEPLSVCTTSLHDSTTLRGWYEDEPENGRAFCHALGWQDAPERMTAELARDAVRRCLSAASILCVLPIQDILAMEDDLRRIEPRAERVNVPATTEGNWVYRMPLTLEELNAHEGITRRMREMVELRRARPMPA